MNIVIVKNDIDDFKKFLYETSENLSGVEEIIIKIEAEFNKILFDTVFRSLSVLKEGFRKFNLKEMFDVSDLAVKTLGYLYEENSIQSPEIVDSLLSAVDFIRKVTEDLNLKLSNQEFSLDGEDNVIIDSNENSIFEVIKALENSINLMKKSIEKSIPVIEESASIGFKQIKLNEEFLEQFIAESSEYINLIEHNLLEAEKAPEKRKDVELINVIFRALHNMKGGSSLVLSTTQGKIPQEYPLLIFRDLSHAAETILQNFRDQQNPLNEEIILELFSVVDQLKILMGEFGTDNHAGAQSIDLLEKLKKQANIQIIHKEKNIEERQVSIEEKESRLSAFLNVAYQSIESIEACHKNIEESGLKPGAKVLDKYIRSLKNLISSAAYQNYKEIENILCQARDILNSIKHGKSVFDSLTWEILQETLTGIKNEVNLIAVQGKDENMRDQKDSRISTKSENVSSDIKKTRVAPGKKSLSFGDGSDSLRVKYEKVDKLMNLIGELIVTKNIFTHISKKLFIDFGVPSIGKEVKEAGLMISRIADDLQDTIMDVRMLPVKNVFHKFPRMVRDICKITKKEVNLVLEGEETRLDKTIIEKINDPLMHIIRNAIDHGIENAEQRKIIGKNPVGTITLRAETQGNIISIEISDDGRGLDPDEIKRKAIEKGLLDEEKAGTISNREIYDFLFMPGFSTAKAVSELSGRGVGLDVVKTNISSISGSIEIVSKKDKGTTVKLLLPLTLVILRGLMVRIGEQEFIIPLESIQETVKVESKRVHKFKNHYVTEIRGGIISLIPLAEIFGFIEPGKDEYIENLLKDEIIKIVVLNLSGQKAGLLVDDFSNEHEVVIKPLEHDLAKVKGISGATILGDGKIVLIINPDEVLQLMFSYLKKNK